MTKPNKNRRWRLMADVKVQGGLCVRVACYWIACQFSILGTILVFSFLQQGSPAEGGGPWSLVVPALIVSTIALPIVLFDLVLFSNRFAGPVLNLRNKLKKIVDHGTFEKIRFRKNDYYGDIVENFNQISTKPTVSNPGKTREIKTENNLVAESL